MKNLTTLKNEFQTAVREGDHLKIDLLLRSGVNINTRFTHDSSNALFQAIAVGNLRIVKFLVENGINVNAHNQDGQTPLMVAIDNPQILEYLFSVGADTTEGDDDGWNIMFHALKTMDENLIYQVSRYGEGVNTQDPDGNTPLMRAVSLKVTRQIKILLDLGANPYVTNLRGQTALDIAKEGDVPGLIQILEKYMEKIEPPTA